MIKSAYRSILLDLKPIMNISGVCRECGISRSALVYFLNGLDSALSVDKLESILELFRSKL